MPLPYTSVEGVVSVDFQPSSQTAATPCLWRSLTVGMRAFLYCMYVCVCVHVCVFKCAYNMHDMHSSFLHSLYYHCVCACVL